MTPQGTGRSPFPPHPLSQRLRRPNYQKRGGGSPDKKWTFGSFAGRRWANLMAVRGRFSRPPLGASH